MKNISLLLGIFPKILEGILYIGLFLTSIYFAHGVWEKFNSEARGVRQYEENIKEHPTIIICPNHTTYWKDFNITYNKLNSVSINDVKDSVLLKIGENVLELSGEKVYLNEVYTRFDSICYNLTAIRSIDGKLTLIDFKSDKGPTYVPNIKLYFTSQSNSYGITNYDWKDGKVFMEEIPSGHRKSIDLNVEKYIHLKCHDQSFYECAASKILKSECNKCNITCIPITLTDDYYPICANDDYEECECNRNLTFDVLQNITTYDECPRSCTIMQYIGTVTYEGVHQRHSHVQYKLVSPLFAEVYEEYIICDFINMIGSVGGTLGLFIGFSFSNILMHLIGYLKLLYNKVVNDHLKNLNSPNGKSLDEDTEYQHKFALMEMELKQLKLKFAGLNEDTEYWYKLVIMEKELKQMKNKLAANDIEIMGRSEIGNHTLIRYHNHK